MDVVTSDQLTKVRIFLFLTGLNYEKVFVCHILRGADKRIVNVMRSVYRIELHACLISINTIP